MARRDGTGWHGVQPIRFCNAEMRGAWCMCFFHGVVVVSVGSVMASLLMHSLLMIVGDVRRAFSVCGI